MEGAHSHTACELVWRHLHQALPSAWRCAKPPMCQCARAPRAGTEAREAQARTKVMFPHGNHRVAALAYHPSRALVCTGGHDSNLKLWSASGADPLSLPPGVKAREHAADDQHWTCAAVLAPPLLVALRVSLRHAAHASSRASRVQSFSSLGERSPCQPSPTLSPTDPVPRGLLTLCPAAQGQGY